MSTLQCEGHYNTVDFLNPNRPDFLWETTYAEAITNPDKTSITELFVVDGGDFFTFLWK